jgi:ketosteroid isomerase-like protein
MQSNHAWVLLVAGLGILHAVSPAPAVSAADDDRSFRAFLQDFERGTTRDAVGRVEYVSTVVSGDLACTVSIERSTVRLADAPAPAPMALRVTHVFRREDGRWTLLHRHADPLVETTAPPSVLKP